MKSGPHSTLITTGSFTRRFSACGTCWALCGGAGGRPFCRFITAASLKPAAFLREACPASTLKRLGLPHRNYKQPEGGRLEPKRLRARRAILSGLARRVEIDDAHRRVMMRNGGADAIDAVIAALGGALAWRAAERRRIARHPRYPREGKLYV